jgi:GAF domain-containing protein
VTQKNIQLLDTKLQLEHRVRDLKLLFDLEQAMRRALSLDEIFIALLGEAMRACEAKMGVVALRDPESRTGAIHVIDERAKKLKRVDYPADVGLIGWAIKHNQMLVTNDAESDPRYDAALDARVGRVGGEIAKTAIAVPLAGEHDAPMGAIAVYNKSRGSPFSDEDRELLELISANASTAIRLQLSREVSSPAVQKATSGRSRTPHKRE